MVGTTATKATLFTGPAGADRKKIRLLLASAILLLSVVLLVYQRDASTTARVTTWAKSATASITPPPAISVSPRDPGLSDSFRKDMAKCVGATQAPLAHCDLTNTERGIPVLWLGFPHTRSARTWDTLTSLATSLLLHDNQDGSSSSSTTPELHPQGHAEIFGVVTFTILEKIDEYPDEPAHCWIARGLCQLQHENLAADSSVVGGDGDGSSSSLDLQSAVFGTLLRPRFGWLRHKKTRSTLAWLAKYPAIKTVVQKRNFFDIAIEEYAEKHPESANILPPAEAKKLIGDLEEQMKNLKTYLQDDDDSFIRIKYDRLYYTTEPSEWQKLWEYISCNTTGTHLTMEMVRQHSASWPEMPPPRHQMITNYEEVSKSLKESGFSKYDKPFPRVDLPPVDWDAIECPGTILDSQKCDLTNITYGVPTIFMGLGRSGTTVTWDSLAYLMSYPAPGQKSVEATGSETTQALAQLNQLPHEHGKCWLERIMCELQHKNGRKKAWNISGIYGTKWKGSVKVLSHPKSQEALQWLAAHPHIRVIYNTRNMLDVAVSRYKHKQIYLGSHCKTEECAASHKVSDMVLPVERLVSTLYTLTHTRAYSLRQLEAFGVKRVDVAYEKLYYSPTADEWMRLLRFMGMAPTANLSMSYVKKHLKYVSTNMPMRNITLANYDEVVQTLNGTNWEKLLIPVWEEALMN